MHNVQTQIRKLKIMKTLIQILFILIASSVYGQNIWEQVNFPDSLYIRKINAEKEGILFVSAGGSNDYNGLLRSYDNGNTWEILDLNFPFNPGLIIEISFSQDNILYINTAAGFCKSSDNGDSFEVISIFSNSINEIEFSPNNDAYGLGWGDLVRSSDGCTTWDTLFTSHSGLHFSDIDFGLDNEIYIVCRDMLNSGQKGFYRSFDNGSTWEHIGITDQQLESIAVSNIGDIIAGGEQGIFTSHDFGFTWNNVSDIIADKMKSYDGDKLIAGRGINNYSGCWFSEDWGTSWISLVDSILNPIVKDISITPSFTVYIQSNQIYKSINPILETRENQDFSRLELFPNPAKNILSILSPSLRKFEKYGVYDHFGQKVLRGEIYNNSLNISTLETGIYIIELESEKEIFRKIIIKE